MSLYTLEYVNGSPLLTAVIVGKAESECVKLGSAVMGDAGVLDADEVADMSESERLEREWEESVLCGISGVAAGEI